MIDTGTEVSGILELGNVWAFDQLIFRTMRTKNQLNKNQNIAQLQDSSAQETCPSTSGLRQAGPPELAGSRSGRLSRRPRPPPRLELLPRRPLPRAQGSASALPRRRQVRRQSVIRSPCPSGNLGCSQSSQFNRYPTSFSLLEAEVTPTVFYLYFFIYT